MSEKRTHTEVLFSLIDRWQKGDVSNQVLIRDLSGMAANTDHLETQISETRKEFNAAFSVAGDRGKRISLLDAENIAFRKRVERYKHALKEMGFAFPTILEGDNPMEVARWFTTRAREALAADEHQHPMTLREIMEAEEEA